MIEPHESKYNDNSLSHTFIPRTHKMELERKKTQIFLSSIQYIWYGKGPNCLTKAKGHRVPFSCARLAKHSAGGGEGLCGDQDAQHADNEEPPARQPRCVWM